MARRKAARKPSYRALVKRTEELRNIVDVLNLQADSHYQHTRSLEAKLKERVDVSMIHERQLLARALGELTTSISQAIYIVVGKEQM